MVVSAAVSGRFFINLAITETQASTKTLIVTMKFQKSTKMRRNDSFRPKYRGYPYPHCFPLGTLLLLLQTTARAFVLFSPHNNNHFTLLYCQLLGMNCATPTDFEFSFQGFCQRGGATDIHRDGWGLCFYQGKGVRMFVDTEAASTSPIAYFLSTQYPIKTLNMISHIRFATRGSVDLCNVHPFQREMVNTCQGMRSCQE